MLRMTFKTGELAPLGRQREADAYEGKANDHVPSANSRDWVFGLRDIEGDDPEEADKEISDHDRS